MDDCKTCEALQETGTEIEKCAECGHFCIPSVEDCACGEGHEEEEEEEE